MSSSRGRRPKKNQQSRRKSFQPVLLDMPDLCDCPSCINDGDPEQILEELIAFGEDLVECEDPLEAELAGAGVLGICALAGESVEEMLVNGLISMCEAKADEEALAMLLAIDSVAQGVLGKGASVAVARLIDLGVAAPTWAAELGVPVTVADCRLLSDTEGSGSMLSGMFHRAGRSHAIVISVDNLDCDAASEIGLLNPEDVPELHRAFATTARAIGARVETRFLGPAEFRWHVEAALDARAAHDAERPDELLGTLDEDDGPNYHVLAVLARTRMNALPSSSRPLAAHGDAGGSRLALAASRLPAQPTGAALPPKRTKSAGPERRSRAPL